MTAKFNENTALVHIDGPVDLTATLCGGQAFRWKSVAPGVWEGAAGDRFARIASDQGGITIHPCDEAAFEGFWRHYLDLDGDYCTWERALSGDPAMAPLASCCRGLRLLNQPVWECLVSFLLSSNNNVKRISGIVECLCRSFGESIGGYHAFPTAERLAGAGEEGVRSCGAGYRASYVSGAAEAVAVGKLDPDCLPLIGYEAAKAELMKLKGIGEKVADCVLLYSCGYREAFPVDVWVRRAMGIHFPDAGGTLMDIRRFAEGRFGKLAGLAQQYLFHYERVIKSNMHQ